MCYFSKITLAFSKQVKDTPLLVVHGLIKVFENFFTLVFDTGNGTG